MFPPLAPFFFVLTAGRVTAAPNKFGSATLTAGFATGIRRALGALKPEG